MVCFMYGIRVICFFLLVLGICVQIPFSYNSIVPDVSPYAVEPCSAMIWRARATQRLGQPRHRKTTNFLGKTG
jgi:hypothetical protein